MDGNSFVGMMGGLTELGIIIVLGFLLVFVFVPLFNWLSNKIKKK